jgi:membrane protein YdbS with pleckstrin-like domain
LLIVTAHFKRQCTASPQVDPLTKKIRLVSFLLSVMIALVGITIAGLPYFDVSARSLAATIAVMILIASTLFGIQATLHSYRSLRSAVLPSIFCVYGIVLAWMALRHLPE